MKIDRVICCLNENPLYFDLWEILSEIWFKKYKVLPTLAFFGSDEGLKKINPSEKYGEVHHIPCNPKYYYNPIKNNDNWEVTWGLFYTPTLFPEDICLTTGIDQIPLGNKLFLDEVEKTSEEKFLVGFGNAYGHNQFYPSSHLVAKGKKYKEIFCIEDSFDEEISKIEKYFISNSNLRGKKLAKWGTDEEWAGFFLKNNNEAVFSNIFNEWKNRRLDRSNSKFGAKYDPDYLKNNEYSEYHLPRPYKSHKHIIDKIVKEILHD